jgi:hypothetical protein
MPRRASPSDRAPAIRVVGSSPSQRKTQTGERERNWKINVIEWDNRRQLAAHPGAGRDPRRKWAPAFAGVVTMYCDNGNSVGWVLILVL